MRNVFSLNTELFKVTGVQKVLVDIHNAIKDDFCSKVVGNIPFENVNPSLGISKGDYLKFRNPFMFKNSIVVIHERKLLILFWLLNKILFQNIKIVYVHHNLLYGHILMTVMPEVIIGISDNCIKNLVEYFHVPLKNIHKIYNCSEDVNGEHKALSSDVIKILYPARINDQKRQVEIVRELRGKLDKRIKIIFAGDGPNKEVLLPELENSENFEYLGFRSDIPKLLLECDYVMLFSKHEGLPISLIEACMTGTPIICSNVGGNAEICINNKNGWVLENFTELIDVLNSLPSVVAKDYLSMSKFGRHMYESNFTFEIFKKKYVELLKEI